ncbi:MAG TPA: sugar phosphate nucleotidyltransferase [Mycobacteriales bacterium]|nr:sugar phosphate nucleotidyltransferase [Mycobacteriales bacterium]
MTAGSLRRVDPTTVILCGGKGTRAWPATAELPKPMLTLGEHPVLRHVMEIYARQGHRRFVLAAGYRAEVIVDYAATLPADWAVEVVDTGEQTNTGGRLRRVLDRVDGTFFATYGDGLGNVDLAALLATHTRHGRLATVTVVALPSPYGTLELDRSGRVRNFLEKPVLPDHLINAGFFVFEPAAFDVAAGEDLEREVLPELGAAGELYGHRHPGFWRSMDTHKEVVELSRLAIEEGAPWLDLPAAGALSPAPPASSVRT